MNILNEIGNLVDDWLEITPKGKPPYYRHRSAALQLSRRKTPITGTTEFLEASYAHIHNHYSTAIQNPESNPSRENWRWKRHLNLGDGNQSEELNLERLIVNACGDDWSNQMPAASGLDGPARDRRAAVDLVYREDPTTFSLIELKVKSDNPLFATLEILMYGLLFVWSKNNQADLGYDREAQPVLAANTVTLAVLAPSNYYHDFDLTILASALNKGLIEFGRRYSLNLKFEVCELGKDFDPGSPIELIRSAINDRRSIWAARRSTG
jgi:hypothetical protein